MFIVFGVKSKSQWNLGKQPTKFQGWRENRHSIRSGISAFLFRSFFSRMKTSILGFALLASVGVDITAHLGFGQTYQLTDLGTTIGTNSYAQGVNNQGQVVGYRETTNGAHAFLYQAGTVLDLGQLGLGVTNNNYALSINNAGQVVGFSQTADGARAFIYQNGTISNFGDLAGVGNYAFGINQNGQIVGYVDTPEGARAILYCPSDQFMRLI